MRKSSASGSRRLNFSMCWSRGHGGTLNPFAFITAVKSFYKGKIILSGAISTGADVAAAQLMGADYAYIGTRFLAAKESNAQEDFKQMVIESTIEDILYTNSFSGVHANYLLPSIVKAGLDPATLQPKDKIDLSHLNGVKAFKDIWSAGQGVTSITKRETTKEIVDLLIQEYSAALESLKKVEVKL